MALLYRSNAQSRVLEHALFSAGLAYRVYGGLRFFERQEVKHALAYLRLIANRDDDTAFARVVNFPTRGIGARSLEALQDAAQAGGTSLFRAISQVTGKAAASLFNFAGLIEKMAELADDLPLPELVDHVLDTSGLRRHYETEKEGEERLENLGELVNAAINFIAEEGNEGESPLAAFLAHASLEAGEHQAGEGEDALQLMTVHAAKGLEFDVVFLSGLEEGLFPHENSAMETKGLEEERRLMYVAVTRARKRLYLSFAETRMLHGQTRYNLQSRFLEEIPAGLTKWLTPKKSPRGFVSEPAARTYQPEAKAPAAAPRSRQRGYGSVPDAGGFRIGQNVRHARFGAGVILAAEGSGTDARVQVNFGAQGTKWLALSIAKLDAA
jgi:DNA helicase-2/ATP-dependent DNA helicase PcrA